MVHVRVPRMITREGTRPCDVYVNIRTNRNSVRVIELQHTRKEKFDY